jgi:polyisoprenoid-binding protein YceI
MAFSFSQVSFAKPEKYKIDPDHASVVFWITHLGFSHVYGMFEDVSGDITLDEAKPENSTMKVVIKATSVNTHVDKRDDHLRSPDFFNVKQYPEITFTSDSFKKVSGNKYQVSGTFDMHGVKKKITIPFERTKTGKDPWGKIRTGANAELVLKRSDYGMKFMLGPDQVGDDVHITLSVEAVKD